MEEIQVETETKEASNIKNPEKANENLNFKKIAKSVTKGNYNIVKQEVNSIIRKIEKKGNIDEVKKNINRVQQQKLTSLLKNVILTVNKTNSLLQDGLKEIATTKNNSVSDIAIGLQNQGKLKVTIEIG